LIPRRGEVWWVSLDPTVGSEITKTRPCVVLTNNILNERRRTLIIVPLSSSARSNPPLLVGVTCGGREVTAVIDQIRAVSKRRLQSRLGEISTEQLESVEMALKQILDLS
jgi:mRNA interferase MazF